MDQYDIKTFLTVVHCKNFSKAAALLYSTQATISHRISMLEKELGYPLLNRRQGLRTVELTQQGAQFIPIAEQWNALWESSLAIKDLDYKPQLFIGATNRLNSHFLPAFYQHLCRTNHAMIPDIRSYHSAEIAELIDRKDLDVGFVSTDIRMKDITALPFLKERIIMICRKGDHYKGEFIHPQSLNIQDEILLAANPEIEAWHNYWWDRYKQPYAYVDTARMAAYHLTEPRFWALCPYSVAQSLQENFPLEIHEFATDVPYQMSYLLYHQFPKPDKAALVENFVMAFKQFYGSSQIAGFLL